MRIAGAAGTGGVAVLSGLGIGEAQATGKLDTPTITCDSETQHTIFLKVCASPSGAPAGFSVQWVKHSDFSALTCGASGQGASWPPSDTDHRLCKASFSGVPGCSTYNLAANACVTVEIGNLIDSVCGVGLSNSGADELLCGTEYVFRAFAHNVPRGLNRSDFTANLCCSTESCVQGCVFTQGYWKNQPCEWPTPFVPGANGTAVSAQCALTPNPNEQCACDAVNTINIGTLAYNQCQLLCSLIQPGGGNALSILAHQLIAAKLNILSGATPPPDCDIAAAGALIGSLYILTGSVAPSSTLGG
jgi:hypothetical protein